MTEPTKLPPKKAVAEALLRGPSMFVHLDPRREGVLVPAWFKRQPQLVLQLGLNMAIPIRDLAVSDQGVSGTLSFNRSPFWCNVPWAAVYALVGEDGRGMVWPDDVPPELPVRGGRAASPASKPAPAGGTSRPKLRLATAAPADAETDEASQAGSEAAPAVAGDASATAAAAAPEPPPPRAAELERARPAAPKRGRRAGAPGARAPKGTSAAAPSREPKRAARARTATRRGAAKAAGAKVEEPAAEPSRRPRRAAKGAGGRPVVPPTQAELPLAATAAPETGPVGVPPAPGGEPATGQPNDAPPPAQSPGELLETSEPKPRRTLPPYLRVIK